MPPKGELMGLRILIQRSPVGAGAGSVFRHRAVFLRNDPCL